VAHTRHLWLITVVAQGRISNPQKSWKKHFSCSRVMTLWSFSEGLSQLVPSSRWSHTAALLKKIKFIIGTVCLCRNVLGCELNLLGKVDPQFVANMLFKFDPLLLFKWQATRLF
jgi:hypothetical protein